MTSTIKVNKIEKVDGSTLELGGPGTAVNFSLWCYTNRIW